MPRFLNMFSGASSWGLPSSLARSTTTRTTITRHFGNGDECDHRHQCLVAGAATITPEWANRTGDLPVGGRGKGPDAGGYPPGVALGDPLARSICSIAE